MSRRPLGEAAMSVAERSRRKRAKAKALRDAALTPDVVAVQATVRCPSLEKVLEDLMTDPIAAPTAGKPDPDYPRMLYHADGRTLVVATPEEHGALTPEGWETIPRAVHQQRPVTAHGVFGADRMAVMIESVIREVFDEYDLSSGRGEP